MAFLYTVTVAFDDEATCADFEAWLLRSHIDDVLAAGAERATVARIDAPSPTLMAQYRFPSREAFVRYEANEAPRLREHGLVFLAGRPATFQRTTAVVRAERSW
jgi:hypothetical protein